MIRSMFVVIPVPAGWQSLLYNHTNSYMLSILSSYLKREGISSRAKL